MLLPKRPANPLSLAVLATLFERPMHPYEMAQQMKERGIHEAMRLNYGSLYAVVDRLQQSGAIEAEAVERDGKRPERTVYRLTETGRTLLHAWMRDLVAQPVREYNEFAAGLCLIGTLPPDEAIELLHGRRLKLREEIRGWEQGLADTQKVHGVPRLFLIEWEYALALGRAELRFVETFLEDLEAGRMPGLDYWRAAHAERAESTEPASTPAETPSET